MPITLESIPVLDSQMPWYLKYDMGSDFVGFVLTKPLVYHGLSLPGMSDLISVKPQENGEVCDAGVFICT